MQNWISVNWEVEYIHPYSCRSHLKKLKCYHNSDDGSWKSSTLWHVLEFVFKKNQTHVLINFGRGGRAHDFNGEYLRKMEDYRWNRFLLLQDSGSKRCPLRIFRTLWRTSARMSARISIWKSSRNEKSHFQWWYRRVNSVSRQLLPVPMKWFLILHFDGKMILNSYKNVYMSNWYVNELDSILWLKRRQGLVVVGKFRYTRLTEWRGNWTIDVANS